MIKIGLETKLQKVIEECEFFDSSGRMIDYSGNGLDYGGECEIESGLVASTGWGDGQTSLYTYGDTCGSGNAEGAYGYRDGDGCGFEATEMFFGDGRSAG
jgi:hypothetical protein